MSLNTSVSIHPILPLAFPPMAGDIKDDINTDAAWHFYSHCIQRNPSDLKSHTRRIFLAMQYKNAKFLAGSLNDLFITLNTSGRQLRIRVLKASAPYLSKADIIHFAKWIKSETEDDFGYKWLLGSMLSKGLVEPNKPLFSKDIEADNKQLSAIDEARSCMEYGQIDLAKKILEEALAVDKDNPLLKKELEILLKSIT